LGYREPSSPVAKLGDFDSFTAMLAPVRHRFTVAEYYRMAETGILQSDARVELLDGEIIDMSPIGPFHGGVTGFLNVFFAETARSRWITVGQIPVHLDDLSEPEPDLLLLKPRADFYRQRHAQPADVFLLIEISDTSLEKDQDIKLPLYAKAGIAECWIVNLNEETIEVYVEPNYAGYASKRVFGCADKVNPRAFPDAVLEVAKLFRW
jgi:Uma2 family endonuclease